VAEIVPDHRTFWGARRKGTLPAGKTALLQRKTAIIMLVGRGFSDPNAIGIDFLSPQSVKTADW
jgi:hypothetical protein